MGIDAKEKLKLKQFKVKLEQDFMEEKQAALLPVEQHLKNLENRKINFEKVSLEEAKDFLTNNTYFYKISLYKDNFFMTNDGNYKDLDFAYLKDLSTMDMHLRYTFLKICLDIEHGIKTKILAYFNRKNPKDGYSIVDRYIQSKHDTNKSLSIKEIKLELLGYAKPRTHHLNSLYESVKEDESIKIDIWKLVECVSVSELINFYIFFQKSEIERKENTSFKGLLYNFRHVRNISAHNSPFFIDCQNTVSKKNTLLVESIRGKSTKKVNLSNQKVSDICSLFYLHRHFVNSVGIISHRKVEIEELLQRLCKNYSYYEESYIKNILDAMDELVDIFYT